MGKFMSRPTWITTPILEVSGVLSGMSFTSAQFHHWERNSGCLLAQPLGWLFDEHHTLTPASSSAVQQSQTP